MPATSDCFKSVAAAHTPEVTEEELKKTFPDQATFKKEEQGVSSYWNRIGYATRHGWPAVLIQRSDWG